MSWLASVWCIVHPNFSGFGLCRNLSDVFWEAISSRQVLSLYQGLETKNLQSFISQFVYFYGYSYFKRLYLETSGSKSIGTTANLILAAAAGACTAIATQVSHLFEVSPILLWEFFRWSSMILGIQIPYTKVQPLCILMLSCSLLDCDLSRVKLWLYLYTCHGASCYFLWTPLWFEPARNLHPWDFKPYDCVV